MKKYRLKIPLYDRGIQYEVGDLFALDYDCYKADESTKCLNKDFVENNPDIFELIEEPQEEVIEGWAYTDDFKEFWIYKSNEPDGIRAIIPARLILNPKPKKEYVRWVMKEFIDNLKNGHPIYRVLATESDYEKYCHKIKITVEEE